MTLEEMKINVYSLIEEYSEEDEDLTKDSDLSTKMNSVINHIQNEISRFKKIEAYKTMEVVKNQEISLSSIDSDIYQLNIIKDVDYELNCNIIHFNEDGTARIFYYRYPKQIDNETDDSYKFELSKDALEIIPYGVAGDLLKSDVSNSYGKIYSDRYKEMLQQLDPRTSLGSIYIEGGID